MAKQVLKTRFSARKSARTNVEGIWNLIERFIVPYRAAMFKNKNNEGNVDWSRRELFDSTAIKANTDLASHIHGAATNPSYRWSEFNFRDDALKRDGEALEWIQECNQIIFDSIQASNFNTEINETYLDLTSFGDGTLVSQPKETLTGKLDKIVYKAPPRDEIYFDFDTEGFPIAYYRRLYWTTQQIIDKFGDKVPTEIVEKNKRATGQLEKIEIIFCVYKREGINANPYVITAAKNRPYGVKYFTYAGCEDLGEEDGDYEMPASNTRWGQVSGSEFGFSPSMIAIWDVLTLNKLAELILLSGEKVIDPTLMTTRKGVWGDIDLSAGGVVVVTDLEKSMQAFES